MIIGTWSAAFTITVGNLQIDFMELPESCRIQILKSLSAGETNGRIFEEDQPDHQKAVS